MDRAVRTITRTIDMPETARSVVVAIGDGYEVRSFQDTIEGTWETQDQFRLANPAADIEVYRIVK